MMLAALQLLGVVVTLGAALYPLCRALTPGLPLHGWPLGKVLALLLLGLVSWWLCALRPGPWVFTAALAALVALGALSWAASAQARQELRGLWRPVLADEARFAALFLALTLLRGFIPDTRTGEKYMDLAILNSIALSPAVPPRNPWLAGFDLNYYYLGHWVLAALARATGIDTLTLFLLAIPLLAAAAAQIAWLLARALAPALGRQRLWVLWLLLIAAPPGALVVLGRSLAGVGPPLLSEPVLFGPTRIMSDTLPVTDELITEFPAFSFLFADVHAHVIGAPFVLLGLALLVERWRPLDGAAHRPGRAAALLWHLVFALTFGSLYAINSADFPLLVGLLLLGELTLVLVRRAGPRAWLLALGRVGATTALAVALLWAFHAGFQPFVGDHPVTASLTPLPWPLGRLFAFSPDPSELGEFLLVSGLHLGLLAAAMAAPARKGPGWLWALMAAAGLTLALWRPVLLVLAPLLVLTTWLLLRGAAPGRRAYLLVAVALLLFAAPEVVMIRDVHFFTRANTTFKWYFQAFLLLTVALPPLIALAWRELPGPLGRRAARAATALTLLLGSLYLGVATAYLLQLHDTRWWGLDGLALVRSRNPDEAAALQWLRAQPDTLGVVEAFGKSDSGNAYLRTARAATFSGRPSPIGWPGHVWLWHNVASSPATEAEIERRYERIRRLLRGDRNELGVACASGAGYIYVGDLEAPLGARPAALSAAGLAPGFSSPSVQVFRCPAMSGGWSNLDEHYGVEQSGAGPFVWLRGPTATLRLAGGAPGPAWLSLSVTAPEDDARVYLRDGARTVAVLPAGRQTRVFQLALELGAEGRELQIWTDVAPRPLGPGDGRVGTLAVGLPTLRPLAAAAPARTAAVGATP